MTRAFARSAASWGVAILLVAALIILAILQYRWAGELAAAEREAMQKRLADSARRVADDFDRRIGSLIGDFQLPAGDIERSLPDAIERWRRATDEPHLIATAYVASVRNASVDLARFDDASQRLIATAVTPQLEELRSRFEFPDDFPPGRPVAPPVVTLVGNGIFIVVPAGRGGDGMMSRPDGPSPDFRFIVLQLDEALIRNEVLPRLIARELGDSSEYNVAIYAAGDREAPLVKIGDAAPAISRADVVQPLLRVGRGPNGEGRPPGAPRLRFLQAPAGGPGSPPPGAWLLVAAHRSGSLESAVAVTRRRNVAISTAVLLLLAGSMAFIVAASRRATAIARQQIDFVAAVTHELNTPITAIRNAGENLADGVVSAPEQVRSYGELIKREGRRLSSSVESMLAFAGMRDEPRLSDAEVAVGEVVGAAVADCRWLADEKRAAVEVSLSDKLPPVRGDAAALQRAFRNLIENAIKYGGDSPRVTIRAAEERLRERSVAVRVEDEGIGFDSAEAAKLFEPFVRGSNALSNAIPGNGIGLSLVQKIVHAHGGTISIAARRGKTGSVVTVTLPAA